MRGGLVALLIVIVSVWGWPGTAGADLEGDGFIATSLPALGYGPTGIARVPDGSNRMLVTMKDGDVRIVRDGVVQAAPFAHLTPVYNASECGVLGVDFDPAFLETGWVYLFVTVSNSEQQIQRFRMVGDQGVERTLLVKGLPTRGANHDGGGLGLGPDGRIYWGIGDNGSGVGVNDDLASLAAKIGRAERDGRVPADNPFVDGNGPRNDYIWARGFRNPYTMTFQPATGLLWVNTVGTQYEQIFVPRIADHAGYNRYENNQPAGFLTPTVVYRTNSIDQRAVTSAVRAGGVATYTTAMAHGFRRGGRINVVGTMDASFAVASYVTEVPSPTTFRFAQPALGDGDSTGGTATTTNLGGAMTGGVFLDSSSFPAGYQGNFVFGDFNVGNFIRVVLDGANQVTSVDTWYEQVSSPTDLAVGDDGDLVWVGISGSAGRIQAPAAGQGLAVTPLHLRLAERASGVVAVRLLAQPAGDVTVTGMVVGDGVSCTSCELTFTPGNWRVPQTVRLVAAPDGDAVEGTAVLRLGAAGLTEQTVALAITDEGDVRLAPSPEAVTVLAGGTARFGVALNRLPLAPVHVTVRREGTVVTSLGFDTDDWSAPQMVAFTVGEPGELTVDVEAAGLATAHVRVTVVPALDAGVPDAAVADAAGADAAGADARVGDLADAGLAPDGEAGTPQGSGCGCKVGTARTGARGGASIVLLFVGLAAMLRRGPRHVPSVLATGDSLLVRVDPAPGDAHAAGVPAAPARRKGGHRHRAHGAPGPAELGAARRGVVSGARGARR